MMKKVITVLMVLLSMAGLAMALAEITIDPDSQTIDVTPSPNPVVTYTVTVNVDDPAGSPAALQISTDSPAIWAEVGDSTPDSQFSTYPFTVSASQPQTFTLYATVDEASESSVNNEIHEIEIDYKNKNGKIKAMVTGNIEPIPEISTGILVSAGLIGILGLVRFRRKD